MIISGPLVFIHNPHTGGSSMTAALCGEPEKDRPGWQASHHIGGMHNAWRDCASRRDIAGKFAFAFVRNPYARLVSAWTRRKKRHEGGPASFADDVRRLHHPHLRPQIWHLRGSVTQRPLDFLGRFENLEEDWAVVQAVARSQGMDLADLPHLNALADDMDWSAFRKDIAAEQALERACQADCAAFGYPERIPYP